MPPIAPENVRWHLTQIYNGNVFDINQTDNFMVGRSQTAQISLNSNKTSRVHSSFVVNVEGHLLVQDLKSINGTFVNGTQIPVYVLHRVYSGDTISFGLALLSQSENDRDKQTFFEVTYTEPLVQDDNPDVNDDPIPVEVNLNDSTTDSRESIDIHSIDSSHSSGRNITAEVQINSHELPEISKPKKDHAVSNEDVKSNVDHKCLEDSGSKPHCSKGNRALPNKWLQKPPSPKKLVEQRKSIDSSALRSGLKRVFNSKQVKDVLESNCTEKRRHTISDASTSKRSSNNTSEKQHSSKQLGGSKLQNNNTKESPSDVDQMSVNISSRRKRSVINTPSRKSRVEENAETRNNAEVEIRIQEKPMDLGKLSSINNLDIKPSTRAIAKLSDNSVKNVNRTLSPIDAHRKNTSGYLPNQIKKANSNQDEMSLSESNKDKKSKEERKKIVELVVDHSEYKVNINDADNKKQKKIKKNSHDLSEQVDQKSNGKFEYKDDKQEKNSIQAFDNKKGFSHNLKKVKMVDGEEFHVGSLHDDLDKKNILDLAELADDSKKSIKVKGQMASKSLNTFENQDHYINQSEYINKLLCTCQNPGPSSVHIDCPVHMFPKSLEKSFTVDQDNSVIIDITDDDDDMDVSSSQIFHMSQIVKTEVHDIHDDTFQKIKNELAEMDFLNEGTAPAPISLDSDDDDDMSGFENTQDICACLEEDTGEAINNNKLISKDEDEELLKVLEDVDDISLSNNDDLAGENMEVSFNDDPKLSTPVKSGLQISKEEFLHKGIGSGKSKYNKPPIIEPHTISKKPSANGETNLNKGKNTPNTIHTISKKPSVNGETHLNKGKNTPNTNKRKKSLETPPIKKKLKNSPRPAGEPPRCDSRGIQDEFKRRNSGSKVEQGKSNNETIREERRKKLKEISERDTPTKTTASKADKGKTVKVLPESKTSRGGFLCKDFSASKSSPRPKTPTKNPVNYALKTIDLPEPKSSLSKYDLRRTKSSGDIKESMPNNQLAAAQNRYNLRHSTALETGQNNMPQENRQNHTDKDRKSNSSVNSLNHRPQVPLHTDNDTFNQPLHNDNNTFKQPYIYQRQPNVARQFYQENSTHSMVSRSMNDPLRRLMWTNGGPRKVRKAPVRRLQSVDDVVHKMVHWLPNWLLEQVDIDVSAPINKPAATKIPLKFKDFGQYYDTFSKLVLLENWQYLFKGFRESSEQPRKVKIEHVRVSNDLMTLDCICYINQKQLKQGFFYKPEDFVLLECVVNDQNNSYMSLSFGFIQKCKKTTISNSDVISIKLGQFCTGEPHTKLEFSILTRYQPNKEINQKKFPIVKVLANIRGHLMLVRAIKGLIDSPLCGKILYPKINEYKFPATHADIIQPHALNTQQRSIVLEAASLCTGRSPGIYCIKGPPGTGKSTVIVNLVFQILFSHYVTRKTGEVPMILLAAPSNTAVDNLLSKLNHLKHQLEPAWDKYKMNIKCVRIGPESSINKDLIGYSLPKLAEKHMPLKNIELPEFRAARDRNENLLDFSRKFFGDRYGHEIKMCEDLIIKKSNIICTTLNSCINGKLIEAVNRDLIKFTCCIIDEATQCHEVEALLPTILGIDKFVLVGDPKQLNATIMNRDASKLGFGESLFSRISNNFTSDPRTPIRMLSDQYRMHPEICSFPNKQFYEGKLRSLPKYANQLPDKIKPYLVFNCDKMSASGDYTNIDEVHLIKKLLSTIFGMIDHNQTYTVGIISPYNAQKDLINENIMDLKSKNPNVKITVNTVDSFQGSENDIIIISCVRDSTNSFLQNPNRLNVALTRAKQALYIVGNYTLFKECRPLYDLREDAKKRRLLLDIRQNPMTIDNFSRYLLKNNSKNET